VPEQRAAHLEQLVDELKTEAARLRGELADFDARHRRERRAYGVLAVFLTGAVAVGGLLLNTQRDTLDYVRSCTTPAGTCYKSLQAQSDTSGFRRQLLGVIAVITDCDVLHDDDARFRACVQRRTGLDASAGVVASPGPAAPAGAPVAR